MTQTEYACEITRQIDEQVPDFDYPASFDSDVEACFLARTPVDDAAASLLTDYGF